MLKLPNYMWRSGTFTNQLICIKSEYNLQKNGNCLNELN